MNNNKKNDLIAKSFKEDTWTDLNLNEAELQDLLDDPFSKITDTSLQTTINHAGFDSNAGDTWIYPNNLPERSYQFNIVQEALYNNTLVVLPTGLGKTFIAAVVMYNIYRWYPTSKIIFMAPTRPLVSQQINACQKIMPFGQNDAVELTGNLQRAKRINLWNSKRVFFATPQAVYSDLNSKSGDNFEFPYDKIKLVVFDEAHRAKGHYVYTEVAQAIWNHNKFFRVLALSATPGRTTEDVAEVIRNLFISHLEVRCELSIDVTPYVHKRCIKTVIVPRSKKINNVREKLLQIIDPYMRQLVEAEVLNSSSNMNRNFLLLKQKRFRERSVEFRHPQQTVINSNFSVCISLYHALELLERHGLRVFLNNFEEDDEGVNKFVFTMDKNLQELVKNLRKELGPNPFNVSTHPMTNGKIAEIPQNLDYGHPKFEEARKCLLHHFNNNKDTRAIVFCEYRESVMLMYRLLLQHTPLLKPRCFVGQGSSVGSLRAITQKQQLQIMEDFRSGTSNILIATSVAEEGIDVGEVDFIVCFDINTTNPTRFVQRIGRTGRNKSGNVVMLVTEGQEEQILKTVLAQKDQTNKNLLISSIVKNAFYKHSQRLVPTEYNPRCVHTFIKPLETKIEHTNKSASNNRKNKSQLLKKSKTLQGTDLRKCFKRTGTSDVDKYEVFKNSEQPLGVQSQQRTEKSIRKIKDFFKELDIPTIPTNTQLIATQTDAKRFRKLNKFFQKSPFIPASQQSANLISLLKSGTLNKDSKFLILKFEPHIVRETYENKKILNTLAKSNINNISADEQDVHELYNAIECIFGDKEKMENFLDNEEFDNCKRSSTVNDISGDEEIMKKFKSSWDKTFQRFANIGYCNDNFDFIQAESKKTDRYRRITENNVDQTAVCSESMVYGISDTEASLDMSTDLSIIDSKCFNQSNGGKLSVMPSKSTPMSSGAQQSPKRKKLKQELKGTTLLEMLTEVSDDDNDLSSVSYSKVSKTNEDCADLLSYIKEDKPLKNINCSFDKIHTAIDDEKLPEDNQSYNFTEVSTSIDPKNITSQQISLELDLNMDDFLDPFSEEEISFVKSSSESQKENFDKNVQTAPVVSELLNEIHDPTKIYKSLKNPSLSAKISMISKENKIHHKLMQSPTKFIKTVDLSLVSPKNNQTVLSAQNYETSPSLLDMYIKKVRKRNKFKSEVSKNDISKSEVILSPFDKHKDESVIIRKSNGTAKRRIIESDSENEQLNNASLNDDRETDFEENSTTQLQINKSSQHRKRRRRYLLNSFIDNEAVYSGSERSEDEAEHTIGGYLKDSVIVSTDDESDDGASNSHMQAFYLRSLKSPQQCNGAFKIPKYRVYNDKSRIYSQMHMPIERSQYLPDSFVVSSDGENDCALGGMEDGNISMCPLERAEKILKEQRRAKRRNIPEKTEAQKPKRRKIVNIPDTSEDEFE